MLCGESVVALKPKPKPSASKAVTQPVACQLDRLNNPRVHRAKRRKEWARKVDVEGHLFWYHRQVGRVSLTDALATAVTVRFAQEQTILAENQEDAEAESMNRKARLLKEVSTDSTSAGLFPVGDAVDSSTETKELLTLSLRDFPTKFAHFVASASALLVPSHVEFLRLSIHRSFVVEESLEHLGCMPPKHLRSSMQVAFIHEHGLDAGGVRREWLELMNVTMVDSQDGLRLFEKTNQAQQSYYFTRSAAEATADCDADRLFALYGIGRLVGRTLLEGSTWGFHFSPPLLKLMLGRPLAFDDLSDHDPDVHRNLQWILQHDAVEELALDFSVFEHAPGCSEGTVVELIPGGHDVAVTNENKHEYVERMWRYVLVESVASELHVFLRGLYEVVPKDLLMLFDHEELDYLLCGVTEIDVDDWHRSTNVVGASPISPVIKWFWELVREMSNEDRCRLLQFATGSARVPLGGFSSLTSQDAALSKFTLQCIDYDNNAPYMRSHACFNRIDLPIYPNKELLETMLHATLETELFGFTTD
ncbi:TPA: hypothetical protein N0F65_005070 [Lagenidium giganteum]|uniref:HECT-type E3 ubiquitin transferase n=1 Tax=Lagenidium giganteum TaxID=4803 RepID=A0AAV2ZI77_9STRA|nr:TPA: hypothetical protein N0F65_005070 [Lagenidium giganteum]